MEHPAPVLQAPTTNGKMSRISGKYGLSSELIIRPYASDNADLRPPMDPGTRGHQRSPDLAKPPLPHIICQQMKRFLDKVV